ncbi:carboxypeptidase-like regulatory domain-containing protein [Hymenobacter metallicola]|uniref:Carboxypeptidase-like regulatory domain-containing protein n=1 Tax=Hymenobacter metallicola TaxID=2563114 RepID=A0A4Z0QCB7_9BACT|nr:carboxypeptidase-like regulatory domain-containing protein [Hymenobacter metallicola]TGE26701.1 hypothetical protein E5K02_18160 [Hymenobacter metallicola]
MRLSSATLTIAQPCTQPWAAMTPQGPGRHCAACQKVVIDFTQKTDAEILAMLAAATRPTCGRFGASQLNRELQAVVAAPRAAWWQTALAATAALLSVRTVVPATAQAQHAAGKYAYTDQQGVPTEAPTGKKHPNPMDRATDTAEPTFTLTGRITDKENGMGLPGVTVLLEGTTHGVSTASDGTFSLAVLPEDQHRMLQISSIGYERVQIHQPATPQPLRIQLVADTRQLGGLVVVTCSVSSSPIYTPQGVWQRLRSIPWRIKHALQGN